MNPRLKPSDRIVVRKDGLEALLTSLKANGRRLVGPTIRDGAIVFDDIDGVSDLPAGWTQEQEAGIYRITRRDDSALFGYVVGPESLKKFLFVPRLRVLSLARQGKSFEVAAPPGGAEPPRLAVLGARPCDLAAAEIQDRVFMGQGFTDPDYKARRERLFVIAVNCGQADHTCFCVSMGTGPRATKGYDLALTEIVAPEHRFVIEVGTEAGAEALERLKAPPAADKDLKAAAAASAHAARQMGRTLETGGLRDLLCRNLEHPRWNDVAKRCLACANCTLVCPTCFCSTIEDTTDLTGTKAFRDRRWDSCFTLGHTYVHWGGVRTTIRARYRQWLVHKMAWWKDQFGVTGCVGCGRCIAWCPAGIDVTREIAAIDATDGAEEGGR